ncbi:helix-turn-helix domain-containing protein [Riemerella columbipharyngis]|uniref:Uncharacterized protein n=1 Tax=Riemerella columbipharyngis TaxID=1071918 RepID=A0A1G7FYB5_9FLAO|nr:helix-turn-helix transcriptional regulator [Riemerella columbipharyngis]SDE80874.1 hypothetical protein SAMN05421544_1325 [Riemerella columbipharyngis]
MKFKIEKVIDGATVASIENAGLKISAKFPLDKLTGSESFDAEDVHAEGDLSLYANAPKMLTALAEWVVENRKLIEKNTPTRQITELQKALGMTDVAAAKLCGISRNTYSKYLSEGRFKWEHLDNLRNAIKNILTKQ